MSPLVFLAAAVVICVLGCVVLALREREPKGLDHTVRQFQREMSALDPRKRRASRWAEPDPAAVAAPHDDSEPELRSSDEARG